MPGSMGEDGVLFQVEAAILREGLMQNASAQAEAQSASSGSWLYMLERFDIGLVHIDRQLSVVGMNDYARLGWQPRTRNKAGRNIHVCELGAARSGDRRTQHIRCMRKRTPEDRGTGGQRKVDTVGCRRCWSRAAALAGAERTGYATAVAATAPPRPSSRLGPKPRRRRARRRPCARASIRTGPGRVRARDRCGERRCAVHQSTPETRLTDEGRSDRGHKNDQRRHQRPDEQPPQATTPSPTGWPCRTATATAWRSAHGTATRTRRASTRCW